MSPANTSHMHFFYCNSGTQIKSKNPIGAREISRWIAFTIYILENIFPYNFIMKTTLIH